MALVGSQNKVPLKDLAAENSHDIQQVVHLLFQYFLRRYNLSKLAQRFSHETFYQLENI